jgi:lactoylglutathione lyase
MRFNHLNLTVADVARAHDFLEKYFGLRSMGAGNASMAGLYDDDGFALVLMKSTPGSEARYPRTFHLGFLQESETNVNEIHQRLVEDGFDVMPPRRIHGAWAFYFEAPGGFAIEVAH